MIPDLVQVKLWVTAHHPRQIPLGDFGPNRGLSKLVDDVGVVGGQPVLGSTVERAGLHTDHAPGVANDLQGDL